MARVGSCRLTRKGVTAIQKKRRDGHWGSVEAFCNSVSIQRSTYYKLIGCDTWFEQATIQNHLKEILGIPKTEQSELYEFKDYEQDAHSTQACPNNLPTQLTSFIGRKAEKDSVKQLLAATSMLTLTGAGGCGKTRLALQVAAELLEGFPDGVRFMDLAVVTTPDLVPNALLSALGLRPEPGRSPMEIATAYLESRTLLLIMDNCEHLSIGCAQLATSLMCDCPQVKILATSREPHHIDGETVWRVPSLLLPDNASMCLPDAELADYDAIHLFAERARIVRPDFVLNVQNGPYIVEICRCLDGMPLAIELVAARIRSLAVEEIHSRLDRHLHLLTRNSPTALPRHQTIRVMIDWSYNLLDEKEKALFARLSIFSGGWRLEAMEPVCAGDGIEDWEVLDLLISLVDKSLVIFEDRQGETRYRLLETLRQYAWEKVNEAGEANSLRNRHFDYYLEFAEREENHLLDPNRMEEGLKHLEAEHANLKSAMEWSLDKSGDAQVSLRLAGALFLFWKSYGYLTEGYEALTRALQGARAIDAATQAKALLERGTLSILLSNYAAAEKDLAETLTIVIRLADKHMIGKVLRVSGANQMYLGNRIEAKKRLTEGLLFLREVEDLSEVVMALNHLAFISLEEGDLPTAYNTFHEGLMLAAGDKYGIAAANMKLGDMDTIRGNYLLAKKRYNDSLAIYEASDNQEGTAYVRRSLGNLAFNKGDYPSAQEHFDKSLELFTNVGTRREIAALLFCKAMLAGALGDHSTASALITQVLTTLQNPQDPLGIAQTIYYRAVSAENLGDYSQAAVLYRESLSHYERIGNHLSMARHHGDLGQIAIQLNDFKTANEEYAKSIWLSYRMGYRLWIVEGLEGLAQVGVGARRWKRATRLIGAAQMLREEIGAVRVPMKRAALEKCRFEAHEALGDAFDAHWQNGRDRMAWLMLRMQKAKR